MVLGQYAAGAVGLGAAFSLVFLSAEFFLPLRTLGSLFHTAMNGMAAADRMFAILDAPEGRDGHALGRSGACRRCVPRRRLLVRRRARGAC